MNTTAKDAEIINKVSKLDNVKNAIDDMVADVAEWKYNEGAISMAAYLGIGAIGIFLASKISNKIDETFSEALVKSMQKVGVKVEHK